jgi:hypothetical protein
MRPLLVIGWVLGVTLPLSCGRAGSDASQQVYDEPAEYEDASLARSMDASAPQGMPAPSIAPSAVPTSRQVARDAELSLVVEDPPDAAASLVRMADSLGGYAERVQGERRDATMAYRLYLRVPSPALDEAMASAKALALRVEREGIHAEDVTDQMVDLDARLTTLEATETELRALLAESRSRASDAAEIMAIYHELINIRTQIEQIRAQKELLASRVAMSSLAIELLPEAGSGPLVGDRWRPGSTVRSAVRTLVEVLQRLVDFAIYSAIVLLPILLILAAPLLILLYVLRRRWRRRRASS